MAIPERIVLILGAGASVPYGYPTAFQLRQDICSCTIDNFIKRVMESSTIPSNRIIKGLSHIKNNFFNSQIDSIDAWLAKSENEKALEAGKFLISDILTQREKYSILSNVLRDGPLGQHVANENKHPKRDWYRLIFNYLTKTTKTISEFANDINDFNIITFNYDQSLEAFLYVALEGAYPGYSKEFYSSALGKIKILHVYGKIGQAVWNKKYPYFWGYDEDLEKIYTRSLTIKLIPEVRNNEKIMNQMKELLLNADKIFFIGFSYDIDNLKIIGFPLKSTFDDEKIFNFEIWGSTFGMGQGQIENVSEIIPTFKPYSGDAYDFVLNHVSSIFKYS